MDRDSNGDGPAFLAQRLLAQRLLSQRLLARVLHDVAGPTTGFTTALDLLGDGRNDALRAEAVALARESLSQIAARIAFCRAAFGAPGDLRIEAFEKVATTPFAGSRAKLERGALPPGAPPLLLQALLILLQISAESLAAGGVARLSIAAFDGAWRGRVDAEGPRARIHPETLEGLSGGALTTGLPGRWAPARHLHDMASSAGGALKIQSGDGEFWLAVAFPS
jgi:histidine phosphotransferase ChpT